MMWFFWLPLLVVPFVFVWAFRHGTAPGCCGGGHVYTQTTPSGHPDPVEIVRQRLARGEITPEEYAEIRRTLG